MEDFEVEFTVEPREDFNFVFEFNIENAEVEWGNITGTLDDQTDLSDALSTLDGKIADNHQEISNIHTTIQGYGDIVSYNAADFATSEQGVLAETALQSGDNISELNNNANYITSSDLPTVNDATITFQKNGTSVGSITLNQSNNETVNITVPTTASDVGALPNTTTIDDLTTTAQQNALNSGATTTNIGQIATNTNNISAINDLIPNQASTSNQLADKNFVNSSIATNTANFIGTFDSVAELEAYSGTLTNNDYAFVATTDTAGNTLYDRYKYTTATTPASWEFEYELNNSSFTSDQWAAINSGATTTNIGLISTALQPGDVTSSYSSSGTAPVNGTAVASAISGLQAANTAVTHTASTAVGNSTTPVYVASDGKATALSYTIEKSVPSNAVFTDTTYSNFTGADSITGGAAGLVPAPSAGDEGKYLKGDGTWGTVASVTVDQTYNSSSSNAQSGVAIAGAGFLTNTATRGDSITLQGTTINKSYAINIGYGGVVYDYCTLLGATASTGGNNSTAIGYYARCTGTNSTAVGYFSNANYQYATAVGSGATASNSNTLAVGSNATATYSRATAIGMSTEATAVGATALGSKAIANANSAMQLGYGTNSTANTLSIGFYNDANTHYNWQLLDGTTGLIPDARISTNIARTSDIPSLSGYEVTSNKVTSISSSSTDSQYPSAKCVYDIVGDIETLLQGV